MTTSAQALAAEVVGELGRQGLSLATAESLTGGLVSAVLTSVPGASAVYRGGLVTYASELKHTLAGVDADWITTHGVINERVVREMAQGARRACGADLALACTGVAGPDPQDGEAPGTVWIALAGAARVTAARCHFDGSRAQVREACVVALFEMVLAQLVHVIGN